MNRAQSTLLSRPGLEGGTPTSSSSRIALHDLLWQSVGVLRATNVTSAILEALGEIHGRGEIHGHLQPELIQLVSDASRESATLLPAEHLVCSLEQADRLSVYRSPEQLRGDPATPASDLHAVGVIFFEMLTGQAPWRPEDAIARSEHGSDLSRVVLTLPAQARHLEPFLTRLIEFEARDRFSSVAEALHALEQGSRTAAEAPASGGPPSVPLVSSASDRQPGATSDGSEPIAIVPNRRRWLAPTLVLLSMTMLTGWWGMRRPAAPGGPEVTPAALALPRVAPDPDPTLLARDTGPTPDAGDAEISDADALPPPPHALAPRPGRSRSGARKLRSSPTSAVPALESESPVDEEAEPTPAPAVPARAGPAPRDVQTPRAPGDVMSGEEAAAWSRTRGGVPLQSFRRPRRSPPPSTP